jgi:UPF0755 protein
MDLETTLQKCMTRSRQFGRSVTTNLYTHRLVLLWGVIGVAVICIALYVNVIKPTGEIPSEGVTVTVSDGEALSQVSAMLEKEGVIRSALWLKGIVLVMGESTHILAGKYYFSGNENFLTVARMITEGDFGLVPIVVTIPEGATVADIAWLLNRRIPDFDERRFLTLAAPLEGYLFPDTYFLQPMLSEEEIIRRMNENFFQRIETVSDLIAASGKSIDDIIIMASILEKEARTMETRRTISGILWRRIDMDIPLQVDAVFRYINGKNTFQLTLTDLNIDSPYNTYRYKGLPKGPIANPGLASIEAAVTPIQSDYLFFLSDMDGNMHYSVTYDEHKEKKVLYLN